jgi:hypothetical protein
MKKNYDSQKGFAVYAVLFFALLGLVVIGGAYYVGKNTNKVNKTDSSATNPATATSTSTPTPAKTDKQLIAEAVVKKCLQSVPDLNQQRLTNLLLKQYDGSEAGFKVHGNYANAGATCDADGTTTNPATVPGSGFEAWLKKTNGSWQQIFSGQQAPGCDEADGEAWPQDILMCVDEQTGVVRATKS